MRNKSDSGKNVIRSILLSAGVLLMIAGVYRGEMSEVFQKATNICLECIGIG